MKIAAIVQARTGSARLPGKVLREVAGKPLLLYLVERLQHATRLDGVIVATSVEAGDDALAELCVAQAIDVHRGPLDDVARRLLEAAEEGGLDAFVRVSADSPLLDQALVDRAVELAHGVDVVTNIFPERTFPHGMSVELLDTQSMRAAVDAITDPGDREHVTPYLYRHPHRFAIRSFTHDEDLSKLQLTVDTPEDLERFEAIAGAMTRPHWEYSLDGVIALVRSLGLT